MAFQVNLHVSSGGLNLGLNFIFWLFNFRFVFYLKGRPALLPGLDTCFALFRLLVNMVNATFPFTKSSLDLFTKSTTTVASGPTVAAAASESTGGWRSWIAYPIMGAAFIVVTVAAVTGHLDKVTHMVNWFGDLWARLKDFRERRSGGGADDVPMDDIVTARQPPVGEGRNMTDSEVLEQRSRVGTTYV